MKTLLISIQMTISIFSFQSQQNAAGMASMLNSYYDVKNALVNADAETAAAKAGQFIIASNSFDLKTIPGSKTTAFIALQKNLIADAERIKSTKDIAKQRGYFAAFSLNFYALAKTVKISAGPVYQLYCPMKNTYWLSAETSIKNPYYGSAMLTCGRVIDTINP